MNRFLPLPLTLISMLVVFCEIPTMAQQPAWPPDPAVVKPPVVLEAFTMRVLSGQNGANIVKKRIATVPVVELRDHNNKPVAGVVINFTSPDMGPSVTFLSGTRTYSAVTELDGRARASGVMPVAGAGAFAIAVTARYDDRIVASGSINQTNYESPADAEKAHATVPTRSATDGRDLPPEGGLSRAAIIGIVVAIAAGAAAGIAIGVAHK